MTFLLLTIKISLIFKINYINYINLMSARNKYLKNLTSNFNSNENIEFIIQQVFSIIKGLKQIKIWNLTLYSDNVLE